MTCFQGQLDGREVLLCVTGGIAAYKVADLASRLIRQGAGVTVAMSDSAQKFITPLTFQALTNRPVYTSIWQRDEAFRSGHISLTEQADVIVVAPATANSIAKIATGLADDIVSTLALSSCGACKQLLAPAMNDRMWAAPATQANMTTLTERGWQAVGPAEGRLACGTSGKGRMSEPEEIAQAISDLLQ